MEYSHVNSVAIAKASASELAQLRSAQLGITDLLMPTLIERDARYLWHPCTQQSDHAWLPMLPIARAEGAYLYDSDGKPYLDAISSWWTCLLGHRHPGIVAALKQQLDTLDHVIFGGCTHEPAVTLAEKLCALSGLQRVFYADIGSAAVEVALKMSYHYWQNVGQAQKQQFLCLSGSYHGETLGALSVTDVALYRQTYGPLLLTPIIVPSPDAYQAPADMSAEDFANQQADLLEQILAAQHQDICALIVEPLVQCAGGMRMYHPQYLKRARAACTRYQVHLIADEIAVGFGRTGQLFATQDGDKRADFLLLGKGLTGGVLPLAAVLTTEAVYQAFYASYQSLRAFLHSHSFTGNPLACRAALACLEALEQEQMLHKNLSLQQAMHQALTPLAAHPNVAEVRQTGMIAAIELVQDKATRQPFAWQQRRGLRVYQHGLTRGALLRPLGNVIYLMPPYCITVEEIAHLAQVIEEGIALAVR
jgi:adenosylmethionine---8-amino-7-oxononanoate aminotransferase